MPLNWLLESKKWQLLIRKLENISLFSSFKAVLAGVTVSVFTPNRIGEYAGRILILKHQNRIQGALSTIIGSIAQIIITSIAGAIGFYAFYLDYYPMGLEWAAPYLLSLVMLMAISLVVLFLSTPTLILLLKRLKALKRFKKYITFFNRYNFPELLSILLYSTIRYAVYCLQFYLLLKAFSISIDPEQGLVLIPVYFFVLTIIPSIALAELGIREGVALTIIGLISDQSIAILSATFLLWLINLVFPAMLGSILIFRSRIFKSEK
jgi:uncharacterized membrane protein YbhN (UPF0104 family)